MASELRVIWTEEAVKNLSDILDYLEYKWTEREVSRFKARLSDYITLIAKRPLLFPASKAHPDMRKAVMSAQTSIYYQVGNDAVTILYLFVNRKNPLRIVHGRG